MTTRTLLIHNPGCTKSRGAKELLEKRGVSFETLEYLKTPLSAELLKELPKLLGMDYPQMLRTGEAIYQELDLKNKSLSQMEWINLITKYPILLERPIFIHDQKAIIARPSEKVLEII